MNLLSPKAAQFIGILVDEKQNESRNKNEKREQFFVYISDV